MMSGLRTYWKNDQVTNEETARILELAGQALGVEGDFVEMGCYKGDTSLLLAEVLRDYNVGAVEKSVGNLGKSGGKEVIGKLLVCLYQIRIFNAQINIQAISSRLCCQSQFYAMIRNCCTIAYSAQRIIHAIYFKIY